MMLRIGTPKGEVVIDGADKKERDILYEAFAEVGWFIEERKASDRVGKGWAGTPTRTNFS